MNFVKQIDDRYICTAPSAKAQKLCGHYLSETWEVFCQWCNNGDICGIGKSIITEHKK